MKLPIRKPSQNSRDYVISYSLILGAVVVLALLNLLLGGLSSSISGLLVPICAYIILAISLNLTVGILGELSLGHAGFMSIGAFSGVVVAVSLQSTLGANILTLIIAMLVGGLLAGLAGFLIGIPVLRLRGDYLAIVTLAFGEIIKNIMNCVYIGRDASGLHLSMKDAAALQMQGGVVIINGPQGAMGVPKLSTFAVGVVLILITLFIVLNLIHSRSGRAIMALRDNRIAAESVGISVTKYKLTAFIISAALAGVAGALYAMNYSTIAPKKFDFNTSILILVFVVLGGLGNIWGSIIATTVLYVLPEMLREYSDYRMLIYAVILILVMIGTNSEGAKQLMARGKAAIAKRIQKKPGGAQHE